MTAGKKTLLLAFLLLPVTITSLFGLIQRMPFFHTPAWPTLILYFAAMIFSICSTLIIIQKISGRYAKEELQQESEENLRQLIDSVKDYAIFLLDPDGKVKSWNNGAERIKGYTTEEIIGQPIEIFYTREDISNNISQRNLRLAKEKGSYEEQGFRVRKDGSLFWAVETISALKDDSGHFKGYTNVTRDISMQKKLFEQINYLANLVDQSTDAIVSVDLEGRIFSWNLGAEKLHGFKKDEVVGKLPTDIGITGFSEKEISDVIRQIRKAGTWQTEIDFYRKDGTVFFGAVNANIVKNQQQEATSVVFIVKDISRRKQLEEELKEKNEELEAFSYSVSHDLRAPLRGIIGFTTILEQEYSSQLDDEAKRITTIIKKNTRKMGDLIDDLLAFSKMGRHEMNKTGIDSNKMVEQVIMELELKTVLSHISWIIHPMQSLYADFSSMRQVWVNLLSNAVKYSAGRSKPKIEISSFQTQDGVVFRVQDNGVGFDPRYADKLFKVFQRLHGADEFEGTGVGLAIVEKIISRHGGRVWAEGTEDQGASFFFSLPVN
jgi:PAS domain S-box-containing protein